MAGHKAARERCTTFLNEKTEAVDPQDVPVLDECPICLDNYVLEQSVRIKVEGCNHVFGRKCLTAILTNNPRLEKKCPLCRTLWMEAPARPVPPPVRPAVPSLPGLHVRRPFPGPLELARLADEQRARQRADQQVWSRWARGPVQPREDRVINLIDSDSGEDALESFNSITRDINSVRERARNTLTSRKQRKEDKKKEEVVPNSRGTTTIKRENGSSDDATGDNGSSRDQQQPNQSQQLRQPRHVPFPTTFWNPAPRPRPSLQSVAQRTQRNWGLPSGTQNNNQNGSQNGQNGDQHGNQAAISIEDRSDTVTMDIDDSTAQAGEHNSPRMPLIPGLPFEEDTPEVGSNVTASLFGPRSSSLRQNQRSRAPPNPFLLSPTPESDIIEIPRYNGGAALVGAQARQDRQEQLDQREAELRDRETRLATQQREVTARQQGLDVREGILTARERTLVQMEERVRHCEARETRLDNMRHRQLREMEDMLARQHQELMRQI